MVKYSGMIRRRHYEAMGAILFNHLQKAVQHSTYLAHIVGKSALRTNSVELVKKINTPGSAGGIEYLSQLGCSFPHVLGDKAIETDLKKRKTQFPSQHGRG